MLEINPNDYYYELEHYTKAPNVEILYQLCDETPARVIDVIFREAVRIYEEDLSKDEEYIKTNSITTTLFTNQNLFNKKDVFWEPRYHQDPFYVMMTINDEMDSDIDYKNHNHIKYPLGLNPNSEKLINIFCEMDIYTSHENWKIKFIQVVFKNVVEAYERYKKIIETGVDEDGIVVTEKLARKLIYQWLYRQYPITSWKEQQILEESSLEFDDCCGGWIVIDKDGNDHTFGYSGIIMMRMKDWLKDLGFDVIDEDSCEVMNDDGIVICPWDNENGYEIFVFHEGD